MKPEFQPGKNIAMKVPAHEFEKTVHFYEVILGFNRLEMGSEGDRESIAFCFGDKNLWIDKVSEMSQAEIWLEVTTNNVEQAQAYLENQGCLFRNEIERLPQSLNGFWLNSPANIIHLVVD